MFLQADDVLVNRAKVSKFGIELGEVTIFFRRMPVTAANVVEQQGVAAE